MHLITTIRLGFAFFVLFHIGSQLFYLTGDVVERYQDRHEQAKQNSDYCNDFCSVAGVNARYGANADNCKRACARAARWPLLGATKEALHHYNLCGIDVSCIDAFLRFSTSLPGAGLLALSFLMLLQAMPSVLSFCTYGMSTRVFARRKSVDPRRAIANTMQVEELDDNDRFFSENKTYLEKLRARPQLEPTTLDTVRAWISGAKTGAAQYLLPTREHDN